MARIQATAPFRPRELPHIPVFDVGPDFPVETMRLVGQERGYAMLDAATAGVPIIALRLADAISRSWLKARQSRYLDEIDEISSLSKRPGAYFLNVHYEWGCTTAAKPATDGTTARLLRVLDWNVNGLGRYVIAARIQSGFGSWVSLTWPGFTGVLQAMAPGRFAAAINQPSIKKKTGALAIDWVVSKLGVWRSPYLQPIHLLRRAFEEAADFDAARRMLESTPICTPVIYTVVGLDPSEVCVIERRETSARGAVSAFRIAGGTRLGSRRGADRRRGGPARRVRRRDGMARVRDRQRSRRAVLREERLAPGRHGGQPCGDVERPVPAGSVALRETAHPLDVSISPV